MDIARAQQFLRDNECAVLATTRRNGQIQMSPVTVGVDAEGRAIISSRETAYKVRNLRRQPQAGSAFSWTNLRARGYRSTAARTSFRCRRPWSRWSTTTGR